jgi:hypothetical protein
VVASAAAGSVEEAGSAASAEVGDSVVAGPEGDSDA